MNSSKTPAELQQNILVLLVGDMIIAGKEIFLLKVNKALSTISTGPLEKEIFQFTVLKKQTEMAEAAITKAELHSH